MPFKTYLLRVCFLGAYFPGDHIWSYLSNTLSYILAVSLMFSVFISLKIKLISQHLMKAHLAKFFIGFWSNHCYAFAFYWLKI